MAKPRINIQGKKFGKLTPIKYIGGSKWECICECGKKATVSTSKLISGHTRSCGCLVKNHAKKMAEERKITKEDVVGRKYGHLKVTAYDEEKRICTCICDCGNTVEYKIELLMYKIKTSCGCIRHKKADGNIRERICEECGTAFNGGARARYCPKCREERKRKADIDFRRREKSGKTLKIGDEMKCERCGKVIIRNSARQRFCEECAKINLKEVDRKKSIEYYRKNKNEINEKRKGGAFTKGGK